MSLHCRCVASAITVALGAWLCGAPRTAAAQTAGVSLNELASLVPPGTAVEVATADGQTFKGRLRSLSESVIVLDTAGAPAIPADAIRTIARRSGRRPVLKGLVIGLGVGAGLGLIAIATEQDSHQNCSTSSGFTLCGAEFGPSATSVAAVVTALGAGIGAGVGALMEPPMRVIYRAPPAERVSIAPLITPRHRGIALSIVF